MISPISALYNNCPLVSVHLRESLPAVSEAQHVHGAEGHQPLRPAGHARLPQVCPEEAQLRE